MDTLRRGECEHIDLSPEVGEAQAPQEGEVAGAAAAAPRKMRITWSDYNRIGKMLAKHLQQQEEEGKMITEEDLIGWYMEQREAEIETEAQLFEQQNLVQNVINRLVDKDRVLIVMRASDDPINHPEHRILVKHPNFPVDEAISGRRMG